jgi:hypothetical protein
MPLQAQRSTMRRTSMVKFKYLAAIAISSTVIANPVLAQPVEPGAYTKNYPNAGLGIRSRRSSRAAISTRSAQTTVWPAPVGHRQPRQADVPFVRGCAKCSAES